MADTIVHSEGDWKLRETPLENGDSAYTIELHIGQVDPHEAKKRMSEVILNLSINKRQIRYYGV